MLISFPFLRDTDLQETDAIDDGTFGLGERTGTGAFPVSHQFGWHGGVHLVAPGSPHNPEPVRAIADGEVVFARHSDPMPSTSASAEIKAPRLQRLAAMASSSSSMKPRSVKASA